MKKLIIFMLTIPLMLGSCEKEEEVIVPSSNISWKKIIGGAGSEIARCVKQTTDGDYLITGYTSSFGNGSLDVFLMKIGENGDSLWTKTFGGSETEVGNYLQQTIDGGCVITGYRYAGISTQEMYLLKTDENGVEQWSKTFGDTGYDTGAEVQQTNDGGYIVVGTTGVDNGMRRIYIVKTDEMGDSLWTKTFELGFCTNEIGHSIQPTSDGGYIITGGCYTPNQSESGHLIKIDENGVEQWSKRIDVALDGKQTIDGGYIIIGTVLIGGNHKLRLTKTDENGIEQWKKNYENLAGDGSLSVIQNTDGGYTILENYCSIFNTDENGIVQWTQGFTENVKPTPQSAGSYCYDFNSFQKTIDGEYIIVGNLWTPIYGIGNGEYDIIVLKTDVY